jgi:hypothetical protein
MTYSNFDPAVQNRDSRDFGVKGRGSGPLPFSVRAKYGFDMQVGESRAAALRKRAVIVWDIVGSTNGDDALDRVADRPCFSIKLKSDTSSAYKNGPEQLQVGSDPSNSLAFFDAV